jgi:hypothetical protein
MICQQCAQAEYVLERFQPALDTEGPTTHMRCPKCRHIQGEPIRIATRLNPIAQALLGRLTQTAVRAGVRGLEAAAGSVAEEGEELLEQIGQKAIDFGKKLRDARTKRGGR